MLAGELFGRSRNKVNTGNSGESAQGNEALTGTDLGGSP